MNIEIKCGTSYHTLEFVGGLPESLNGIHQNSRSHTFAGAWNTAVDLLIVNRFALDLSLVTIQFAPSDSKVQLEHFLKAGGFDEALESDEEIKSEFWLRLFEVLREKERYAEQMANIISKPMSPRLKMKMDIRQGFNPSLQAMDVNDKHENETMIDDDFQTTEITLCVTFGDVNLTSQFIQSLSNHAPLTVDIHIVACCFRISPKTVKEIINNYDIEFRSIKILDEYWGYEQAKIGNMGPWYKHESQQHGVSWGRSVLHRAAAIFSPTQAMWILDDDVIFQQDSFFNALHQFDHLISSGAKVGIGAILGDAPLLPPYIVRTQAIDFFYAGFLKDCDSIVSVPLDMTFHDMHHDLSTERTSHLEFPLGIGQALNYSQFNLSAIQGKSLTRSIHSEWKDVVNILARGGNTLVIGKDVLLQFSNMAPNLGGIMCRRGDTLWVKRIQTKNPRWVRNVRLALKQQRQEGFHFGNINDVRGDIIGSMLVRSHNQTDATTSTILRSAFIREARLIGNLKRTLSLLDLMEVKSVERNTINSLLDDIEKTPWPEKLAESLDSFTKAYPLDVVKFQQRQGV